MDSSGEQEREAYAEGPTGGPNANAPKVAAAEHAPGLQNLRNNGKWRTQVAQEQQPRVRRLPRTAAVQLACPEGKCANMMRLAREKISLVEVE